MELTRRELMMALPASVVAATPQRSAVLVELFTSEGCSSCPPADELLIQLTTKQPVAGAQIVALGQHVDYWNRLGWTDPFSAASFSQRQSWYAEGFRSNGPYTPQMVVDGHIEFVGNDQRKAIRAVEEAARVAKLPTSITWGDEVSVSIEAGELKSPAEVFVAIVENGLTSAVKRGENGGRNLRHAAVVRNWQSVGTMKTGIPFTTTRRLRIDKDWNSEQLAAVVFAQEKQSRRVVAAASIAKRA